MNWSSLREIRRHSPSSTYASSHLIRKSTLDGKSGSKIRLRGIGWSVGPQPDGSFGPDVHQNGDVFVFSAITNGGRTSTISVYTWAGSPGTTGGANFACANVKSPEHNYAGPLCGH